MAAQVSSFIRNLNCYYYKNDQQQKPMIVADGGKSTALITQDLLGASSISSNLDHDNNDDGDSHDHQLDLDLQVPKGWEKRLDLKSGKIYIQKSCNSPKSSTTKVSNSKNQTVSTKLQDFNLHSPPSSSTSSSFNSSKSSLNLFDDTNLDLKLVSSSSPCQYQSVCTLDKVKFALDRVEGYSLAKKRPSYLSSQLSSSSGDQRLSTSKVSSGLLFAAGCPNCLIYIMISKTNPRCPRCHSIVPSPITKKPRIDLSLSI